MCVAYLVLSLKLVTDFLNFSIFIASGKEGNSSSVSCNFLRCWTSPSRKYPSSLSSLQFFIKSSLDWDFDPLKIVYWKIYDIAQPNDLFIS